MFAKLHNSIADSTLMEQPLNVRCVFMLLLAIADPEGYVPMTPRAAAARLNIDLDVFNEAVETLMSPDPHSNFPDYEGRRLIPSDKGRGWLIPTYAHYSAMRNQAHKRQYMREYMRNYRAKQPVKTNKEDVNVNVNMLKSLRLQALALLDVDADVEKEVDPNLDADEASSSMLNIKQSNVELPGNETNDQIPF